MGVSFCFFSLHSLTATDILIGLDAIPGMTAAS